MKKIKKGNVQIYKFPRNEMILRDFLAIDRTMLANERTFLAWFRTSISLIAGGGALLKLDIGFEYLLAGYLCIIVGVILGVIGKKKVLVQKKLCKDLFKLENCF